MAKKNSCDCSCPTGSCHHNNGCGEEEEKVLTESGLRHIIDKLTGKLLLAVGTIKAKGEGPLHLWRKYTKLGVIIHGKVDEATDGSSGLMSAEDKAFLDKLKEWFGDVESFTPITVERIQELWGDWTCNCGGGGDDGGDDEPEPEPDPEPEPEPDYGELTVTLEYSNIPAAGGTVSPAVSYLLDNKKITPDSVEFRFLESVEGAEIDALSGDVSYTVSNETKVDLEVGIVEVTITYNGITASATCAVTQNSMAVIRASGTHKTGWSIGEEGQAEHGVSIIPAFGGTYPLQVMNLSFFVETADGREYFYPDPEDCAVEVRVYTMNPEVWGYEVPEGHIVLNDDNSITVQNNKGVFDGGGRVEILDFGTTWSWYCEKYGLTISTYGVEAFVEQIRWSEDLFTKSAELKYISAPAGGGSVMPQYNISMIYDDHDRIGDSKHNTDYRNYREISMEELEEYGAIESLTFSEAANYGIEGCSVDVETGEVTVPENTTGEERKVLDVLMEATVDGSSVSAVVTVVQEANN